MLLALITSCDKISPSQEGGDETSGSYIFFEPEVLEGVEVKSNENLVTGDKLPDGKPFGVLGYYCIPDSDDATKTTLVDIFDNPAEANDPLIEEVYYLSTENGSSYYKYNDLALWKPNINHIFYGFYPYDLVSTVKLNNGEPYIEYTQPTTMEDMVDILTANRTLTQATATNNSVDLTFTHSLWALDFVIKNSQDNADLIYKDVKISFYGFNKTAEILFTEDKDGKTIKNTTEVTVEENNEAKDEPNEIAYQYTLYSGDDATIAAKKSKDFDPILFLPVNGTDCTLKYRLEVKIKNSRGVYYTYTYPSDTEYQEVKTNFKAGMRYNLTLEKKDPTGNFSVNWKSVSGWTETTVDDYIFN